MELKVYNKSCLDMKELKNESVNLVVTSPPYGKMKNYSNHSQQIGNFDGDAQLGMLKQVFKECYRVLKDGGFCCVNIGYYFTEEFGIYPYEQKLVLEMIDLGYKFFRRITWCKDGGSNQQIAYSSDYIYLEDTEPILIFVKIDNVNSLKGDVKYNKSVKYYYDYNVWRIRPYMKSEGHIAEFPEEIPKRLIEIYSKENDYVLDPFLGSGTTMKVANQLKRNCVGYELVPKYVDIIKKKVGDGQMTLFGEKVNVEVFT